MLVDPHFNPLHLLSGAFVGGGFILLASARRVLFAAQQARQEEREVRAEFGEAYARYAAATPAFVPRLRRTMQRQRA
jgi:protein-S-isoprenylcysteine O-methyltransferase Ste14